MFSACIAVVDAARCRLFSFHRSADEDGIHETLLEAESCENENRHGAGAIVVNDHRARHHSNADLDFARLVLARLRELGDEQCAERFIFVRRRKCSNLRPARTASCAPITRSARSPRDLASLTPSELRTHLAERHVLPEVPHTR